MGKTKKIINLIKKFSQCKNERIIKYVNRGNNIEKETSEEEMLFENKFTARAECALRAAHESAAEMGHGYVGSEHILLGLLAEKGGMAYTALSARKIN